MGKGPGVVKGAPHDSSEGTEGSGGTDGTSRGPCIPAAPLSHSQANLTIFSSRAQRKAEVWSSRPSGSGARFSGLAEAVLRAWLEADSPWLLHVL